MRKPSAATALIAISLLLSAWGNVIAACFCPRYAHMDHHMPVVQQESSCDHEMPDMKMDGMRMDDAALQSQVLSPQAGNWINGMQPTAEDSIDHAVIESRGEQCRHCLMFSRSTSAAATLAAVNPASRLLEGNVPLVKRDVAPPSAFSVSIIPTEHGPPGNLFPRHILISIFRI